MPYIPNPSVSETDALFAMNDRDTLPNLKYNVYYVPGSCSAIPYPVHLSAEDVARAKPALVLGRKDVAYADLETAKQQVLSECFLRYNPAGVGGDQQVVRTGEGFVGTPVGSAALPPPPLWQLSQSPLLTLAAGVALAAGVWFFLL